jgi:hypothetical protein
MNRTELEKCGLIDCWVVPEEPFHRRVGWVGTATTFGVVIIAFDKFSKESLIAEDSKVKWCYPCGWYARFPYEYAFGKKILVCD